MSYFDDQFEAWMENDCQGDIEDYDSDAQADVFSKPPASKRGLKTAEHSRQRISRTRSRTKAASRHLKQQRRQS